MTEPLREVTDGVVWYYDQGSDDTTKHEGDAEIYPNWVRLAGPIATWLPRERVDQVHES